MKKRELGFKRWALVLGLSGVFALTVGCGGDESGPSDDKKGGVSSPAAPEDEKPPERQTGAGQETAAGDNIPANFYATGGVALGGTDPVAYFKQGSPVRGDAQYVHEWKGVTWRFANAENRDAFAANPSGYAPQYGGYCAWAVSQGYLAPVIPEAWKIVDGKLYLNASLSVQRTWERDITGFIAKADSKWPGLAQ